MSIEVNNDSIDSYHVNRGYCDDRGTFGRFAENYHRFSYAGVHDDEDASPLVVAVVNYHRFSYAGVHHDSHKESFTTSNNDWATSTESDAIPKR